VILIKVLESIPFTAAAFLMPAQKWGSESMHQPMESLLSLLGLDRGSPGAWGHIFGRINTLEEVGANYGTSWCQSEKQSSPAA